MEKQDAQQLAGEHFILTPSAEPSGILGLVCSVVSSLPVPLLTPCVIHECPMSLSSEK